MKKTKLTKEGLDKFKKNSSFWKIRKRPYAIERLQKPALWEIFLKTANTPQQKKTLHLLRKNSRNWGNTQTRRTHNHTTNHHKVDLGSKVKSSNRWKNWSTYDLLENLKQTHLTKDCLTLHHSAKLSGKKVGDEIEVMVPAGRIRYRILEIEQYDFFF